MRSLVILILASITFVGCSTKSDLDFLARKHPDLSDFVDSLKSTSLFYQSCHLCDLNGLEGETLIGITESDPPNGNYDKKEIEIGVFDYITYIVSGDEHDNRKDAIIYICHFNKEQKEKFIEFSPYYSNRIAHHKLLLRVKYVANTVIIMTEIQG